MSSSMGKDWEVIEGLPQYLLHEDTITKDGIRFLKSELSRIETLGNSAEKLFSEKHGNPSPDLKRSLKSPEDEIELSHQPQ